MNVEIADRLIKLRKEKGYTQESLADALGISRQAVSKWERAEASPDTDNLICLAKLYNVSLDELLSTDESVDDIREAKKEETKEDNFKGIHIKDDGDEVTIGISGIHVKDKDGSEVHIGMNGIHIKDENGKIEIGSKAQMLAYPISLSLATIIYLIVGFIYNLWHPMWILFIFALFLSSIVDAVVKRKLSKLNIPCLTTSVYLFLGFYYNLWHPSWVVFLLIPIFYSIVGVLEKKDTIIVNNSKEA